jgi:hypothetical protein
MGASERDRALTMPMCADLTQNHLETRNVPRHTLEHFMQLSIVFDGMRMSRCPNIGLRAGATNRRKSSVTAVTSALSLIEIVNPKKRICNVPATRSILTITRDNIERERVRIGAMSSQHAVELVLGCRTWKFTNPEGFKGTIIVWPDNRRAALVSQVASHWGEWNNHERTITLDNGDVYSDEGGVGEDA